MNPIVHVNKLTFAFEATTFRLFVDELSIDPGELVALIGPSGSGKTTLLHLLTGIRLPSSGNIVVDGVDIATLNDAERREFRVRRTGLVFQDFELLEHLSVIDNILLPYRLSSSLALTNNVMARASQLAETVEIGDKTSRLVGRLSQGERQRVAVCRALVTQPELVFADEPTGNLDPDNKWNVLDMLVDDARRRQSTLITVTHDYELLDRFDRVVDFAEFHSRAASIEAAGEVVQ